MILFEMAMLGCIAIFCIGMVVMMFCLGFDDTETFTAIDEKIARLIDADALKEYIDAQKGRPFIGCTIGEALKIMTDEQPTVDAVPVIRCKDCKYATKVYRLDLPWLTQWEYSCRYYNTHSVMGDDWCSRAERKEE